MPRLYAVFGTRGPAWRDGVAMEEQAEWRAHADFMNALEAEGFVLLGGPLEGTRDVLLVVRAENADDVLDRLAADPWARQGLLAVPRVTPWTLRLGSLA